MKALCVTRNVAKGESPFGDAEYATHLTPGKWYTVYGVNTINGVPTLLVHDDIHEKGYPMFEPASCFGDLSGDLPGGLVVTRYRNDRGNYWDFAVVAPAFRRDPTFYDRLTDGEREAVEAWQVFKAYVDASEPDEQPLAEVTDAF